MQKQKMWARDCLRQQWITSSHCLELPWWCTAVVNPVCSVCSLPIWLNATKQTKKETRQPKWIWPRKLKLASVILFLTAWESLAVVLSLGFFFCLCLNASMQGTKHFLRKTSGLTEDHIPAIFHIWERWKCYDYFEILHWLLWMWEGRD